MTCSYYYNSYKVRQRSTTVERMTAVLLLCNSTLIQYPWQQHNQPCLINRVCTTHSVQLSDKSSADVIYINFYEYNSKKNDPPYS